MILGRVNKSRTPLREAVRKLLDPRVSSRAACRAALGVIHRTEALVVTPERVSHWLLVAPSRAGKGICLIIPELLTCPDSMVVHDPKGELYKLTASARRRMGHQVVFLAPYSQGDSLNPLATVDPDSDTAIDDCRDIAQAAITRTGKESDPYWNDSAEIEIAFGCAFVVAFLEPRLRNLQTVKDLLSDLGKRARAIEIAIASDKWGGILSRWASALKAREGKELAGVMTTVTRHLTFLDTPAVRASTTESSFDPGDLKRRPMTVYLCLPPERVRAQMGLLRLWVATCIREVVKQGTGGRTVRLLLDESAALGRLEVLDDVVDKFAGYNIKATFVYQSLGQLARCWDDGGTTLLSCTSQILFAVNDQLTAEFCSKRCGSTTVAVEGGGSNDGGSHSAPEGMGHGSTGRSWGASTSWSQAKVALLLPEQVMTLPQRTALVFIPSMPPVAVNLIRYYDDPLFQRKGVLKGAWLSLATLCWALFVLSFAAAALLAVASDRPGEAREETPRQTYPRQYPDIFWKGGE